MNVICRPLIKKGLVMKNLYRVVFTSPVVCALLLSMVLIGCGGGGSSDDSSIDDDINGIWEEKASGTIGIISYNGAFVDIIHGYVGHLSGRLYSRDGVIYDSILTRFWAGSIHSSWFSTEGTVIPKDTIDATYETQITIPSTTDPLHLVMQYSSLSERPSSLSLISGIWSRTQGDYTITITINNDGSIFGSDTYGCTYAGTISIPDAKLNIYTIYLDKTGCSSYMQDGRGQGVLMDGTSMNDTLLLAVSRRTEPSAIDSIVIELSRQ